MFTTRFSLMLLLGLMFMVNIVETGVEDWIRVNHALGEAIREMGYSFAIASHSLEGNFSFEYHDVTNMFAVYGYSLSYFFFLPVIALAIGIELARRKDIVPFRVFTLAIVIDYFLSLPFFLFFPVPERWYYSHSGAMLLSDRWTSALIEVLRPVSGLDNSFPSTHVAYSVIIILICYRFKVRMRNFYSALAITVVLSTYVLGIHWIADMIAGTAVAVLSVALAERVSLPKTSIAS